MSPWTVNGYRTVRLAADDHFSVELQDSGPCAIRIPHRGWHTVSIYLKGPVDMQVESQDYAGGVTLLAGDAQLLPGSRAHRCVWTSPVLAVHVHIAPPHVRGMNIQWQPRMRCPELMSLGATVYDFARRRESAATFEHALSAVRRLVLDRWILDTVPTQTRIGRVSFERIHRRMRGPSVVESDLSELAELAGLSERQFRHAFGSIYGTSPKRFLVRHRVEHAKVLIHEGGSRLTDVAVDAGFYDQAHFGRTFKALVGETPTRYARSLDRL